MVSQHTNFFSLPLNFVFGTSCEMSSPPVIEIPQHARSKLEELAWEQSFVGGTFRMEYEPGSKAGDGFIGQVVRVRIRGDRLVDGAVKRDQQLSLICKFPFENRAQREQFHSMALFEREVFVYKEVLPEFEKLQLARGLWTGDDFGFWNYPRCYWALFDSEREESLLILEDLMERNLELKDKYVPIDYDHVEVLMVALGKLNACSFALKEQKPIVFEKIKRLDDLLSVCMTTEQTQALASLNCTLAASIFTAEQDASIKEKLLSLKDSLWQKSALHIAGERTEPYGAFNHGDCWTNNVMFGYNKTTGTVNDIVLFDWQMARYSSPVLDFLLFIYLNGELSLRREKFPQLLKVFHESFCRTFRKLGGDPEKAFPFEVIAEQIKQFGILTLAMGTFALPRLANLPDDFFEKEENRHKNENRAVFQSYEKMMRNLVEDTEKFDDLE